MRLENWFPYKQLEEEDTRSMFEEYGSWPVTSMEQLEVFFQYQAYPMLRGSMVKQLMVVGAEACTETFDIEPKRGKEMFGRGALLYSGVLAEVAQLPKVPCEPDVWMKMLHRDIHQLTWNATERLESESASFCDFMRDISSALEVSKSTEWHLLKAGAGIIHLITTESLRAEESRSLESDHPELDDLEAAFKELDQ